MSKLWYSSNANEWNKALPLGNGYMGAMCFGGTLIDRFQLNNDSVWWGGFRERINPDAKENIPIIQRLIREGKIRAAEELATEAFSAIPDCQSHYEPLADVFFIPETEEKISFLGLREYLSEQLYRTENLSNYRRELDIENGIHTVSYTRSGVYSKRESFISYPDKVMAVKCQGAPLRIIAERGSYCEKNYKLSENTLCVEGQTGANGVKYCLVIRAIKGNPYIKGRFLHCDGDCEILMASQTDFYCDNYLQDAINTLDKAEKLGYDELEKRHIADFSALMNRCSLQIECEDKDNVPTDKRLEDIKNGTQDIGLVNLAFAYGRYLLVSSSREGSLPANLQGIWNDSFTPAWDSKYTININTQMNYWPAEVTGLSELHTPLFEHIKRMYKNGKVVANKMYGARGWVAHHNTDLWGDCAPQDSWMPATLWQMGGAWLCVHILEHYRFTGDKDFIREYLPIIKEAVLFFEDTLIENSQGELVVSPSTSPENSYIASSGEHGNICEGASMDAQILYELLTGLIETQMLSDDEISRYTKLLQKLPQPKIETNGTIQEWAVPYEEAEIGHRHIAHLFALYPAKQFFEGENSEALLVAARKTLERRLSHGGGHTGWSRAWIINLWARLKDSEKCHENIVALLQNSMLPNMFDNHPPFQIDGNFGFVSGIAEMLIQSHTDKLDLAPVLPKAWKSGKAKGLRARGGITVSFKWRDGEIYDVCLTADDDTIVTLADGKTLSLKQGVPTIIG